MIKNFTTPEFTDLLKQHGIEIDTPFVVTNDGSILVQSEYKDFIDICDGSVYTAENYQPTYLLSVVLTWLPEEILNGYYLYGEVTNGIQFWGYADDNHRGGLYWKIESKPIEQLITQGLTEGWLTKEIIEQQIKDN